MDGTVFRNNIIINNPKLRHFLSFCLIGLCGFLTACASQSTSSLEQPPELKETKAAASTVSKVEALGYAKPSLKRGGGVKKIGKSYKIGDVWYHPELNENYSETGSASWYGNKFHGSRTANGEIYDMNHLTAAHPTMPLPSYARVTNIENGSSLIVRVNDRGPFTKNRIIDLSNKAADLLGYKNDGVAKVHVEYVGPAPIDGDDDSFLLASYKTGDDKLDNDNASNLLALQPKEVAPNQTLFIDETTQMEIIKQIEAKAEMSPSDYQGI